jgi:hypothetical protein
MLAERRSSPRDGSVLRYAQHVIIPGPYPGKLWNSIQSIDERTNEPDRLVKDRS